MQLAIIFSEPAEPRPAPAYPALSPGSAAGVPRDPLGPARQREEKTLYTRAKRRAVFRSGAALCNILRIRYRFLVGKFRCWESVGIPASSLHLEWRETGLSLRLNPFVTIYFTLSLSSVDFISFASCKGRKFLSARLLG